MGLFYKKEFSNGVILGIWKIQEDISTLSKSYESLLPTEEDLTGFNKISREKRQKEWICTRLLLNQLSDKKFDIIYNEDGKPIILNSNYNISITHSKDIVAVIISEEFKLGIDIEYISNRIENISQRFLSKNELEVIDKENRLEHLYLYWSAKEALYKLYSKKYLEFNTNIIIHPFEQKKEGTFNGEIITKNFKGEYLLNYCKFENYILVWTHH